MVEITYLHSVHILPDILQRCEHSLLGKTSQTKNKRSQIPNEKETIFRKKICMVKISYYGLIWQKNLILSLLFCRKQINPQYLKCKLFL